MANPFAGFEGPTAAKAKPDESLGELSRLSRQLPEDAPDAGKEKMTSEASAFGEGVLDSAGMGFRDEIRGASKASGLPEILGGFRAPVGAARMALGDEGARKAYEEERDATRQIQKAGAEEHPVLNTSGQLAGALLPTGLGAAGQGWKGAAKVGGLTGAAYGAGSGETLPERATQAVTGGVLGGTVGALAGPAIEKATELGSRGLAAISRPFRAWRDPEQEAAKMALQTIEAGKQRVGGRWFTADDIAKAEDAGQPLFVGDMGKGETLALAKWAANASPEARGMLTDTLESRAANQGERVVDFLKQKILAIDTNDIPTHIEKMMPKAGPFYKIAMNKGKDGLIDDELNQMAKSGSEMFQGAFREAGASVKNKIAAGKAAVDDFMTPDQKPTLAYWDQVKRKLDDKINGLKKDPAQREAYSDAVAVRNRLVDKLDEWIPEYKKARGVSAEFFKASNAFEAGEKFLNSGMKRREFDSVLKKMHTEERDLFGAGYVDSLIGKIEKSGYNYNIAKKLLNDKDSEERLIMAVGPKRANEVKAMIYREGIMNKFYDTVRGGSQTAQYLMDAAAFGVGNVVFGNASLTDPTSWLTGAAGAGARRGAVKFNNGINSRLAEEVAKKLISNDPKAVEEAIKRVSKNPWMMKAMQNNFATVGKLAGMKGSGLGGLGGAQAVRADEGEQ